MAPEHGAQHACNSTLSVPSGMKMAGFDCFIFVGKMSNVLIKLAKIGKNRGISKQGKHKNHEVASIAIKDKVPSVSRRYANIKKERINKERK
jgi:hypothetical protein